VTTPLRVAIVGAGWMGATHARAVTAHGDVIAAVVDPDVDRCRELASEYGAMAFAGLDAMKALGAVGATEALGAVGATEALGAVDAAVIATPTARHLDDAIRCLRHGVACLVEKPHRLPFQDPTELLRLARESGAICHVGMTTRHSAGLQAVHAAARSGELGRLLEVRDQIWFTLDATTLPAWYFDRRVSGGGVLLTNGVHALDRVAWLIGEPLSVDASRLDTVIAGHEVDDHAVVSGHGATTGVPFTVSLLWSDHDNGGDNGGSSLTVVGDQGRAHVTADGSWVVATRRGTRRGGDAGGEAAFARQWAAFAGAVRGHGPDDGPHPHELEPTLALIETIYRGQPCRGEWDRRDGADA